ncbi:MAG: hypothetical protein WAU96_15850 [Anaerolineae bacterium]|nr:hypothetical protein [Thermoflexales bacterium]HQW34971.1 hypothetical protein [Thermoflexales bacterium]
MDFYSKDLEAWINEAQADPQTAAQIITALAGRITQLQLQNDALLAENLLLKRASGGAYLEQIERLRAGMADIKSWAIRHRLERQTVLAASFSGEVLQFMLQRSDRFEKESEQTFSLKTSEDKPLADLRPIYLAPASNLGQVLFVSSSFRAQIFGCVGLPVVTTPDWKFAAAPPLPMLKRGERIEAMTTSDEFGRANALTLVTRRGFVRTLPWLMVENLIAAGHPLLKPAVDDDAPVHVSECNNHDILVATRQGKWLRFPITSVDAAGANAFSMDAGDDAACATEVAPDKPLICFVSDSGAMLAVKNTGLEAHQKPGAKPGNLPRGFRPVACFAADEAARVLTLSREGELDITPVNRIPVASRLSEAKLFSLFSQRVIGVALIKR